MNLPHGEEETFGIRLQTLGAEGPVRTHIATSQLINVPYEHFPLQHSNLPQGWQAACTGAAVAAVFINHN